MSTARTLEPPAAPMVRHAEGALVDRAAVTAGTAALVIAILGVVVTATVLDSNTPWRSPVLTDIQEVAVMPYAMMVKIKQEDFANGKNSN